MPFTPFHLLAITPIKAVAKKKFSWTVFALVNVLIDIEPIGYFLITLSPEHQFFHTIIGATLIAILTALYGKSLCEGAIKIWNAEMKTSWLLADTKISSMAAWSGALIGAWTHLFLDSFMHDDIKPLSPFTESNVLLGTLPIPTLHTICVSLGFIGLLAMLVLKSQSSSSIKPNQRRVKKNKI